jgi:hypothetical protein
VNSAGDGYDAAMTAPGQEPDEVLTGQPGGEDEQRPAAEQDPDLDAVGDSHMPEDLRDDVRERAEGERAEQAEELEQEAEQAAAEREADREQRGPSDAAEDAEDAGNAAEDGEDPNSG